MLRSLLARRLVLAPLVLAAAMLGCTTVDRTSSGPDKPNPTPSSVAVQAHVISALLADDCRTAEVAQAPAKRAKPASPPASAVPMPADMAVGGPSVRPVCTQSTLQLKLTAGSTGTPAKIEIAKVRMLDDANNKELATLVPRNPQLWNDTTSAYAPWDTVISANGDLRVSYDITAPDWDAVGGGSRWNTQNMTFRVEVTVRVAGKDITLEQKVKSPYLMRDPPVPT